MPEWALAATILCREKFEVVPPPHHVFIQICSQVRKKCVHHSQEKSAAPQLPCTSAFIRRGYELLDPYASMNWETIQATPSPQFSFNALAGPGKLFAEFHELNISSGLDLWFSRRRTARPDMASSTEYDSFTADTPKEFHTILNRL